MSRSCDCSGGGGGAETPFLSERQEMYCDAATPELSEVKCGGGVFLNVWIKEKEDLKNRVATLWPGLEECQYMMEKPHNILGSTRHQVIGWTN